LDYDTAARDKEEGAGLDGAGPEGVEKKRSLLWLGRKMYVRTNEGGSPLLHVNMASARGLTRADALDHLDAASVAAGRLRGRGPVEGVVAALVLVAVAFEAA